MKHTTAEVAVEAPSKMFTPSKERLCQNIKAQGRTTISNMKRFKGMVFLDQAIPASKEQLALDAVTQDSVLRGGSRKSGLNKMRLPITNGT